MTIRDPDSLSSSSSSVDCVRPLAARVQAILNGEKLCVLEWARERLANTHRLAADKTGADRDGWLEDAAYWQVIVTELKAARVPAGTEESFPEWLTRQIIAAREQFDTATSLRVRRRSWDAVLLLQGIQQEYSRRTK